MSLVVADAAVLTLSAAAAVAAVAAAADVCIESCMDSPQQHDLRGGPPDEVSFVWGGALWGLGLQQAEGNNRQSRGVSSFYLLLS